MPMNHKSNDYHGEIQDLFFFYLKKSIAPIFVQLSFRFFSLYNVKMKIITHPHYSQDLEDYT